MRDRPPGARFAPDELGDEIRAGEWPALLGTARDLEWLAANDDVAPSADFASRVMAAIGREPTPRPVVAAASAARRGTVLGLVGALGDLWRVAWTGGRPLAARAPAMALVVVLLVAVIGGGALGAGAVAGLFRTPAVSPSPIVTPAVNASPAMAPTPSASQPATETAEPGETPDPSEGSGSGPGPAAAATRPDVQQAAEPASTERSTGAPTPRMPETPKGETQHAEQPPPTHNGG